MLPVLRGILRRSSSQGLPSRLGVQQLHWLPDLAAGSVPKRVSLMARFVWIRQHGHFSPQFWPTDGLGNPKGLGMAVLAAEHQLSETDAGLTFDDLIAKYPAPTVVAEVVEPWEELPRETRLIEDGAPPT